MNGGKKEAVWYINTIHCGSDHRKNLNIVKAETMKEIQYKWAENCGFRCFWLIKLQGLATDTNVSLG